MKKLVFTVTFLLLAVMGFCQSYAPELNNPKVKVKPAVAVKAYAFPLGAITENAALRIRRYERCTGESMPDNPNRQAFFYGPVLLAGDLGTKEPDPTQGVPVFVTSNADPNQWIKPDNQPLAFETTHTGTQLTVKLKPFYELQDNYYTVYWDVFTPESWKNQQAVYEQKRQ